MLKRVFFRQIRQSLGRYIAIILIIALGVGFFTGLRVTKTAMLRTADEYLSRHNFYDFRLVSTLGFTQDDVDALQAAPEVAAAEGEIAVDFLCSHADGEDIVLSAHSIPDALNTVELTEGRMPEHAGECLIDYRYVDAIPVGSLLRLSSANESDTSGSFSTSEYTVVGAVSSPVYLNYERGSTALGNGRVAAFVYMPAESFSVDYYTSIYIKVDTSGMIYSQEYEDCVETVRERIEQLCTQRADLRYDTVVKDARGEIGDGKHALIDGWIQYYTGLSEYQTQKADVESELQDAKAELDSRRRELDEAKEELAAVDLDAAQRELEQARQTLAEGEAEYALEEKRARHELVLAENELAEAAVELSQGEDELKKYRQQFEQGKKALDSAQETLDAGFAEYEEGREQLSAAVERAFSEINALLSSYIPGMELDSLADLNAAVSVMEASGIPVPEQLLQACDEFAAAQAQLDQVLQALLDGQAELDAQRKELETGYARLVESEAELADARVQYEEGKTAYAQAKVQVQAQLEEARAQLDDAAREIGDNARKLADARQAVAKLADYERQWQEGYAEYEDARARAQEEFASARKELSDAAEELADGAAELNDAEAELAKLEKAESYVLDRTANIGYVCFENDSGIVESVSRVFPLFFFLIAALVCITTMTRMVDEQRTQIGTLKALGFSEGAVMSGYMFYSGSASVIGCLAGFFAGAYFFPRMLWEVYAIMYGFAPIVFVLDWGLAAISILSYLACAEFATWYACKSELAEVAAELIRPKAPKAGKRVLLERMDFLWRRLKFMQKVCVRNIFRYKNRLFMMTLGIGGCTALLVAGFGINDSISGIVDIQYEEIDQYDLELMLTKAADTALVQKIADTGKDVIGDIAYLYENTVDVLSDGQEKNAQFIVSEDLSGFVDLHNDDGQIPWPGEGEAVLNDALARQLDVGAGDTITLRDGQMREMTVRVSGIFTNYVYNYVYINPQTYEAGFGEAAETKNAYVLLREGCEPHEASAVLMELRETASVSVTQDMRERVNSMLGRLRYIVYIVIICSGALAFIVLYNLTNINITERVREIATIKVLGFTQKESGDYVFRENIILTVIGALAGLGLGVALHRYIMAQIQIDMVSFNITIHAVSFLIAFAMTLAYTILIDYFMMIKIDRIKMAESLKSIE